MGMRATFARVTTSGTVYCTSVQWATYTDHLLRDELRGSKLSNRETMRNLIRNITKINHVSSLGYVGDDDAASVLGAPIPSVQVGEMLTADRPQMDNFYDGENSLHMRKKSAAALRKLGKTPQQFADWYHTEDGLSFVYDERDPDVVTFMWDLYEGVNHKVVTLDELTSDNYDNERGAVPEYRGE